MELIKLFVILLVVVNSHASDSEEGPKEDPIYSRLFWTDELVSYVHTGALLKQLAENYSSGKSKPSDQNFADLLPKVLWLGRVDFSKCNPGDLENVKILVATNFEQLGSQSVDLYVKTVGKRQLDACEAYGLIASSGSTLNRWD